MTDRLTRARGLAHEIQEIHEIHEQDLIDAVQSGRWPGRVEPALAAHVADCDVCRDVAAVASMVIADSRGEAGIETAGVRLPDARAVWLRAQWRARAEAERRVTHPITAAQAGAIAATAALGGVLLGATSASVQAWLGTAAADLAAAMPVSFVSDTLVPTMAAHATVALGIGIAVVLAPAVAFLATRE